MPAGANLVNLRVLDENGEGNDADVIAAIQKAIALKDKYNIRVINLSLGRGVFESYTLDPLCQAVEQAWKAGIAVVVAAGNEGRDNSVGNQGYGTITAPGNDPFVITVGAMNTRGSRSPYRDHSRQLQFEGAHGHRSRGQAGPGRAGEPGDFSVQCGTHAEPGEPLEPDRSFSLQCEAAMTRPRMRILF